MHAVISALLPVFLAIVLGYLLRRTLLREESQWAGLERLTYYVLIPGLVIEALATADFSRVPAFGVGATLFCGVIAMAVVLLAVQPLLRRQGISGPTFTSMFQGATRWNAMVALAVAGNLFGQTGITMISVAMLAMIPLLNVLNVWVLAHHATAARTTVTGVLRALAENPMIWSCAVGIALYLLAPPVPALVYDFAKSLGRASLILGLLLVGSGLDLRGLRRPDLATVLTTVLKLAVMPAFAIALGWAFGLSGASLGVVVASASVPTASSAYVLARQMGGDAPVMAQILTLQTIVAMASMPLIIWLVT